ncbi:putative low affinity copper transporter [Diaporthe ampelina]|uniref:Copper transport protein n=1 Tax=Diaporthe ampelina TaxID=1214573 RepID=A0A0G2FXH3_9PEZI|nr:putative low affinity copper transporter [Diaporthe ampelina]
MNIFPRHGDEVEAAATMTGMDGMDMDGSSSMMATMMVAFHNDIATTLYSEMWTPSSAGTYAATCIFIIMLAAIFRSLFALKAIQEGRWLDQELNRRYVVVNGRRTLPDDLARNSLKDNMMLSANGVEEEVMVVKKKHSHARPWRFSVDPIRAVIDTVIAGVGYLLMLAVMTMNLGYFLSVLGGTFLGSLAAGRYAVMAEH